MKNSENQHMHCYLCIHVPVPQEVLYNATPKDNMSAFPGYIHNGTAKGYSSKTAEKNCC